MWTFRLEIYPCSARGSWLPGPGDFESLVLGATSGTSYTRGVAVGSSTLEVAVAGSGFREISPNHHLLPVPGLDQ